jgi:hypothetical protein
MDSLFDLTHSGDMLSMRFRDSFIDGSHSGRQREEFIGEERAADTIP